MSKPSYFSDENYGFLVQHPTTEEVTKYKQTYLNWKKLNDKKVSKQRKRWKALEKKMDENMKKLDIKKLVRKGIPPEYRGKVWFNLSGAATKKKNNPGLFDKLRKTEIENDHTKYIDKDIPRTFPEHPNFNRNSLDDLRDILYAYAIYNEKIGYCQAMNYLAGILLLHMPAEDAFWTLVAMLSDYLPLDLYSDKLSGLKQELHCLSIIYSEKNSKVYKFLHAHDCDFALFASQWFMCLFVNSLPMESTMRIWDVFFFEGYKVLYRVSITILNMLEKEILKGKNNGDIMTIIKNQCHMLFDCRMLMKNCFNIKRFSKEKIKNHRSSFILKQKE